MPLRQSSCRSAYDAGWQQVCLQDLLDRVVIELSGQRPIRSAAEARGELLGLARDPEFETDKHPVVAVAACKTRRLETVLIQPHPPRRHLGGKFSPPQA